jgi:fatty acid desaturase
MRPRFAADYRTLVWAFLFFPLVPVVGFVAPALAPWLLPIRLYLAYCAGILSHNQNHCPVFHQPRMNRSYAVWLSIFYGYPIFAWIPTHNANHHKFLNGPGDVTMTSRHSDANTLLVAVTYFFTSAYWQSGPTLAYILNARRTRPRAFRTIVVQFGAVIGAHAALVAAATWLHGAVAGLSAYALAFGLPCLFALWSMMFTNYVQHVHCDPSSSDDHSRNFVSRLSNWLTFNGGYHTVHHEQPGVHWSLYPALHAARASRIDPALNERSILSFCLKNYALGVIFRGLRSKPVERAANRACAC